MYDRFNRYTGETYAENLTFDNYNVLDRADKITLSTGNYINYTYDGSGSLVRKQQYSGGALTTTTDYVGGFV